MSVQDCIPALLSHVIFEWHRDKFRPILASTGDIALKIGVGLANRADVGISCLPRSGVDIAGVIILPVQ